MNYGIYAIKDQVTGLFGEPFLALNKSAAVRRFNYVCEKAEMVALDSQLFCLGEICLETGDIKAKVDFMQGYTPAE